MEMVGAFYRFCANNFMDFNDFFEEKENLYEKVPELDKATLMKWMKKAAVAISEKLKSARNNTSRRLITDAKNVVAERYMEPDFSLDTVKFFL